MPPYRVITPPADEPLTLGECRQHLNVVPYEVDSDGVGTHPDDASIMALQAAAREHCENFLGLSLSLRVLEAALDKFPTVATNFTTAIELPMGPVVEVVSVAGTGDSTGGSDAVEIAVTDYELDDFHSPMRLVPSASWPSITAGTNAVRIRYTAGFGVDSDGGYPLPAALRAALLLVLGHLYANRETSVEKALTEIPLGAEALMRPHRVLLGMA
jgi:uncharacterized phiE125 gp8 family phage protein